MAMTKEQTERALAFLERIAVALESSNPPMLADAAPVEAAAVAEAIAEPTPPPAAAEPPLTGPELEQLVSWAGDVVGWLNSQDREGDVILAGILGNLGLQNISDIGDNRALARTLGERLHAETVR